MPSSFRDRMLHPMSEEWRQQAACKGMDPNRFFVDRDETVDEDVVFTCLMCPVREQCLDWALVHERDGYWGGTGSGTRKRIRRQRGISLSSLTTFELRGCGTVAGYSYHRRHGEVPCIECRRARSEREAENKVRREAEKEAKREWMNNSTEGRDKDHDAGITGLVQMLEKMAGG